MWRVDYSQKAAKQLKKIGNPVANRIVAELTRIATTGQPRSTGKPLTGNLAAYWRYRIGDYRVICEIHDNELIVVAVDIGHRSNVYK